MGFLKAMVTWLREQGRIWKIVKFIWRGLIGISTVGAFVVAFYAYLQPGTVVQFLQKLDERSESVDQGVTDISDNTSAILEATRALPDAVATDPVRELYNRGYQVSRADFLRSVNSGDVETVRLMCMTGRKGWMRLRDAILTTPSDDPVVAVLSDCFALDMDYTCGLEDESRFDDRWAEPEKRRERYVAFCGKGALKTVRQKKLENEARFDKERQRAVEKIRQQCLAIAGRLTEEINAKRVPSHYLYVLDRYTQRIRDPSAVQCDAVGISWTDVWKKETAKYN
ncbi:MAG: hypothetical protein WA790_17890 [Sulfitobacter sp.]